MAIAGERVTDRRYRTRLTGCSGYTSFPISFSVSMNATQNTLISISTLTVMVVTGCAQEDSPAPTSAPVDAIDVGVDVTSEDPGLGPDWSVEAMVPPGTDRANIYGLAPDAWQTAVELGLDYAQVWPVTESGLLLPY